MLLCGVDAKRPLLHDLCIDNETIIPKLKKKTFYFQELLPALASEGML